MSLNTFVERKARVTVNVTRADSSGEQTPETYTFIQHRMRINVRQGGNQFGNAKIEIYGVPPDTMNNIARLWLESLTPQNTDTVSIDVFVNDDYVPFFQGVITWSAVNGGELPAVSLVIEANTAFALSNVAVSPYANAGPVALRDALAALITPHGFALDFAADIPAIQCTDLRLTGAPLDQVIDLMRHYPQLTWTIVLQRLIVRLANAPLTDTPVRVAVDNGMNRLPVYSSSGIQLDTLFNPLLRPGVACDVETQQFDFVNRTLWVAAVLSHQIEPNVPGGRWTTSLACNSFGAKGNGQ